MTTPIVRERPAKMLLVSALGVYSRAVAAAHTLVAVAAVTVPPLSTRETVAVETPACAATSPMVALFTRLPPTDQTTRGLSRTTASPFRRRPAADGPPLTARR